MEAEGGCTEASLEVGAGGRGFTGLVHGIEGIREKSRLGETIIEVPDHNIILSLCDLLNEPGCSCWD